jgi:hypothetical protein
MRIYNYMSFSPVKSSTWIVLLFLPLLYVNAVIPVYGATINNVGNEAPYLTWALQEQDVEIIREVVLDNNSFIIKRNDVTLNDLQNVILSYDPDNHSVYAYFMTNGYLEKYSLRDDSLTITRLDTLYRQGEELNAHMMVLSEEEKIILWEVAIGHVLEYSMNTGELVRVDQSRVRDFMFGAGSVYVDSLGIFAFGGYGLWEHKNFLLQYAFDLKEWIRVKTNGEVPPKSATNFMWFSEKNEELLFGSDGAISSRVSNKGIKQFLIYSFHLPSKTWVKKARHNFYESTNLFGSSFRHQKVHSIDTINNLAHLRDRLFIDLDTYEILELSREDLPDINSVTAFYETQNDQWLLIGRKNTMDARNMWIIPIQLNRDMLQPVASMSMIEYLLFYETPLLLLGVLVIVGLFFGFKKIRGLSKPSVQNDQLRFESNGETISVFKNGTMVLMNDEYIEKIWKIIYRQKQQNEPEIMMIDFDEELFTVSNSTSYRSKMKVKLFNEINLGLNSYIIQAKRSSLDKRYKVIEINLSIIQPV